MNPKFFPICLLVLQTLASVVYFSQGDWRKGVYYLLVDGIIITVSF